MEGTFRWIDGTSPNEMFFAAHQPDNDKQSEHCGLFWRDYNTETWNDATCNLRAKSICRWRPDRSKNNIQRPINDMFDHTFRFAT
jgi:hypothetical protein